MQGIFEDTYLNAMDVSESYEDMGVGHRASCHRCGNIRKNVVKCTACPHVFCKKCCDKMTMMDGPHAFTDGCPFCKDLCCCGPRKSVNCQRPFHCYKKCLRSRMSPRSRNASPRLSGTAMAQRSSSDTLQGTSAGKTSPMEVFLRDYTDSEDEGGFLPATCLPSIDELPHEELRGMGMGMNICMDSQFTELSDAPPFGKQPSSQRRPPSGLAPIDTTVGSPRTGTGTGTGSGQGQGNGSRPKSKRSREAAETPSKKAKTEEALLRAMHISARHACYSPQPPFNSGVPSIFAPQSLTPETNPFFLQSTLPSCQRLPPIRTLLQSELANPFAAYIPVALHAELPHARFHVPDEVSAQVRREAISAVDPAVGYGFTFGNTAAVGPPPEASATSFTAAEEASRGTGSVVTPTESTDAPGQGFSAYVSTPNIDRACQYLSFREAAKHLAQARAAQSGSISTSDREGVQRSSEDPSTAESAHTGSSSHVTLPPFSPVAGLFCTPIATEGNDSSQPLLQYHALYQPQHMVFTQCSGSGSGADGSGTPFDWSGESLQHQHLGVEVLTPAGLPLCTPMTATEPASQEHQQQQQQQQHLQTPHSAETAHAVTLHRAECGADHAFASALKGAAQMLQRGQMFATEIGAWQQHVPLYGHGHDAAQYTARHAPYPPHILSPPPRRRLAPQEQQQQKQLQRGKEHEKQDADEHESAEQQKDTPAHMTRSRAKGELKG